MKTDLTDTCGVSTFVNNTLLGNHEIVGVVAYEL